MKEKNVSRFTVKSKKDIIQFYTSLVQKPTLSKASTMRSKYFRDTADKGIFSIEAECDPSKTPLSLYMLENYVDINVKHKWGIHVSLCD